jgi:hypothetical protein
MVAVSKSLLLVCIALIQLNLMFGCKGRSNRSNTLTTETNNTTDSLQWISAMDDPNANYFEAVKSFDKFWSNRQKPMKDHGEGMEIFGNDSASLKMAEEQSKPNEYAYEYKRFLNWQQRNKNLVKPDGSIMTAEEIIENWNKQKNDTITR